MANEITYALGGDIRAAAILHQELATLLADRASLMGHSALVNYGDMSGRGSTVLQVGQAGLDGYDKMASVAEGASVANTALTDASVNITIARQALQYEITDLMSLSDSIGLVAPRLAQSMVGSADMRFTQMVCEVTDDFTAIAGTSGINMSVDDWFDAQFALTQAGVPGPYLAILHPVQLTDWQGSLRAETGVLSWQPASAEAIAIKGQGYAGQFGGVDVFSSQQVPTANAGADRAGGMFGAGAVGYATGMQSAIYSGGEIVVPAGAQIVAEFSRNASAGQTIITGNLFCGVAIVEDSRGVSIITDA